VVECLLGLPILPAHDIVGALRDIHITIAIPTDHTAVMQLQQLVAYIKRQSLDRRFVLSDACRDAELVSTFRSRLKTELFNVAYVTQLV